MLAWLATQMEEVHGLRVGVRAGAPFHVPNEDMRVVLFQSVRELLFNVVKHAETDHATVELCRVDHHLAVTVRDEGRGFDPEAAAPQREGGFGMANVQERLGLFGARMEVESVPGEGTHVTLFVPSEHVPLAPGEGREDAGAEDPEGVRTPRGGSV